jgi:hypothetical protein
MGNFLAAYLLQGLLQSEAAEDGSDQVGFFGKCLKHGS